MKPLAKRNPFWLGVNATAIVAALVLATIGFGSLGLGEARYLAEFAQSADLQAGDEVRVAGLRVGEVTSLGLEDGHVLVRMRVDRDVHLGPATEASIKLSTLLGGRYVELRPIGQDELPDGRIPLAHTQVPYDLQKVLQTGTPLLEELDPVKFRDALRTVTTTFRGDGPRISAALDGMSRLSELVVRRRDQVSHLITGADRVAGLVDQRTDKLFALLGQSDVLLRELLRRRDTIRGVLTDLAAFTGELRKAIAENESEIRPLLDKAAELTDVLREQDEEVDDALELLAPTGRYVTNATGNGPFLDVYLPYSLLPDNVLCRAQAVSGCK